MKKEGLKYKIRANRYLDQKRKGTPYKLRTIMAINT